MSISCYSYANFNQISKTHKLPDNLLKSICTVESGLLPYAYNPTDSTHGAFGICQLLPSTAWYLGIKKDSRCLSRKWYRNDKVNNTGKNCILFNPYVNMTASARFLNKLMKMYGRFGIDAVIAAYNSGSPKICKNNWVYYLKSGKKAYYNPSKCKYRKNNQFVNQPYVDRVNEYFKENKQ